MGEACGKFIHSNCGKDFEVEVMDKLLTTFSRRKQVRNNQGLMHNSEGLSTNLADLSTFFGFLTVF